MIFVSTVAETYFLVNGAFLILFISICFHHRAFYKIFESTIEQLGNTNSSYNDKLLLCQLVKFHVSVTECVDSFSWLLHLHQMNSDILVLNCSWFRMTADLYSRYIFVHLISDMVIMAGIMFEFDIVSLSFLIK